MFRTIFWRLVLVCWCRVSSGGIRGILWFSCVALWVGGVVDDAHEFFQVFDSFVCVFSGRVWVFAVWADGVAVIGDAWGRGHLLWIQSNGGLNWRFCSLPIYFSGVK